MAKLKLLIGLWGRTVLCQVLEQDESLRETPERPYDVADFAVISASSPMLDECSLFIQGAVRKYDNRRFCYKCDNKKGAEQLIVKIKTAVAAINAEPSDTDVTEHTIALEIIE